MDSQTCGLDRELITFTNSTQVEKISSCCKKTSTKLLYKSTNSFCLVSASFFHHIRALVIRALNKNGRSESGGNAQLDLTGYVLLLQGEPGIPKKTLKNIWNEVDMMPKKEKDINRS